MNKTLNLCLLAFFTILLLGCSKSNDSQPNPPGPDTDKISIPILASYLGNINITNNKLTLYVNGEADLTYYIPPGKDTTITITGAEAISRKGKAATLTMSCAATNSQGILIPICYDNDGIVIITSLTVNNSKIQWIGKECAASGNQIILRIKLSQQYKYPGEYIVNSSFFTLGVLDNVDLDWRIAATTDTIIILSAEQALSRIGKPFWMKVGCQATDPTGNFAQIDFNFENGVFRGNPLLTDNPKVEWIGHRSN